MKKDSDPSSALFLLLAHPYAPAKPGARRRNRYGVPGFQVLAGEYAGDYEAGLIKELHKLLPDTPPWKQ